MASGVGSALSWRVALESVDALDRSQYRVGDVSKRLVKHVQSSDHPKLKNIIIELTALVSAGGKSRTQVSRPFNIDTAGSGTVSQALLMPVPLKGKPLVLRVLIRHSVQADALIGEASISEPAGKMCLELLRKGKPRGTLFVDVTVATLASNVTVAREPSSPRASSPRSRSPTRLKAQTTGNLDKKTVVVKSQTVDSFIKDVPKKPMSKCCNSSCCCGFFKLCSRRDSLEQSDSAGADVQKKPKLSCCCCIFKLCSRKEKPHGVGIDVQSKPKPSCCCGIFKLCSRR